MPGTRKIEVPLRLYNTLTRSEESFAPSSGNTVRLYAEFRGTLTPEMDVPATDKAMAEYTAIRANKR